MAFHWPYPPKTKCHVTYRNYRTRFHALLSYLSPVGINPVASLPLSQSHLLQKSLSEKVEKDFESGLRSGVNGTPTFFINGKKFDGNWADGDLLEELRMALA